MADAEAFSGSDAAQARVRRWWRLTPQLLIRPTTVFAALRDDDETDVEARSEPILAIVLLAGMAGILLTPAWRTLLDEQSLDWLVLAVVTFIGGLFYGAAGYFLLGFVVWVGARGVGVDTPARPARQLVGLAALPVAISIVVTVPAIVLGFGYDWFRTGGSDDGTGRRRSCSGSVSHSGSGHSGCSPLACERPSTCPGAASPEPLRSPPSSSPRSPSCPQCCRGV